MNQVILRQHRADLLTLEKTILKPATKLVETAIKRYDKLDVFAKIRLLGEIQKLEPHYSYDLKTFLLDRISHSITLTLNTFQKFLDNPLDGKTLEELAWKTLTEILTHSFQNMTLDERIDRAVIRTFQAIAQEVNLCIIQGLTSSEASKTISKHFLSNGQVAGGSAQLWTSRLLVGESLRAYQQAAKNYFRAVGIQKVQLIARDSDPVVYEVDNLPDYPYPGCTWSLVPIT